MGEAARGRAAPGPGAGRLWPRRAGAAGHAGARPGGQTHYRVVMRSAKFKGLSRIDRSRAVHAVLAEDLAGGVHALALDLAEPAG